MTPLITHWLAFLFSFLIMAMFRAGARNETNARE